MKPRKKQFVLTGMELDKFVNECCDKYGHDNEKPIRQCIEECLLNECSYSEDDANDVSHEIFERYINTF